MIQPPPSPTLFPYTTLFRSLLARGSPASGVSTEPVGHHVWAQSSAGFVGLSATHGAMRSLRWPATEHCVLETCSARKRSEEHTSELQSRRDLVCRLLLEKKN